MRKMYTELFTLNNELIGEYTKRSNNHQVCMVDSVETSLVCISLALPVHQLLCDCTHVPARIYLMRSRMWITWSKKPRDCVSESQLCDDATSPLSLLMPPSPSPSIFVNITVTATTTSHYHHHYDRYDHQQQFHWDYLHQAPPRCNQGQDASGNGVSQCNQVEQHPFAVSDHLERLRSQDLNARLDIFVALFTDVFHGSVLYSRRKLGRV